MKTATKAKAPRQTGPTRNETGNTSVAGHNGNGSGAHAAALALPASAGLRDELNDLRKKREKGLHNYSWDRAEKLDKIDGQIVAVERRLEAAEVRELPEPTGPRLSRLEFIERDVPVVAIRLTGNHRETEDEAATVRLARSIKSLRLQQRVGLRDAGDGTFELIWGSRRLAAVKLNGDQEIPAKVYPSSLTAAEVEILRTIENFGRKELTHVERAIAVARTIDAIVAVLTPLHGPRDGKPLDGWAGFNDPEIKPREPEATDEPRLAAALHLDRAIRQAGGLEAYVGLELGFPARWVKDNAYVSKLGGKTRQLLAAGRLDVGHARELAKLGDPEAADAIAEDAARNELGLGGQDVAFVRRRVTEVVCSLKVVPWRLEVAFGRDDAKGCGGWACAACPHNSKSDPDLFGGTVADEPAAGVCTNPRCFEHKQRLTEKLIDGFVAKAKTEVKKTGAPVTERGLHHLLPIEVKPASAVRKAKKVLEPPAAKAGGTGGRGGGYEPRKLTPEETAQNELDQAERGWREKALKALLAAAKTKPLRLAAIALLDKLDVTSRWHWTARERQKQMEQARPLGELAARGDGEAVLELAKKVAASRDLSIFGWNTAAEFLEIFVSAWGVKLAPAPKLEDFLPKPKGEEAEKSSAKDAKSDAPPSARRASLKAESARAAAATHDDGFEDPDGSASAPAEIRRFINNQLEEEKPFAWKVWNRCTGKGGDNPDAQHPGLSLFTRTRIRDALKQFAEDEGIAWSDPDEAGDVPPAPATIPLSDICSLHGGKKGAKGNASAKKGGRR